jgi:hypothetical protein
MTDADNRSDEDKKMAERRMTDPGIYAIGEDVIWDGEAETLRAPTKTKVPLPPDTPGTSGTGYAARADAGKQAQAAYANGYGRDDEDSFDAVLPDAHWGTAEAPLPDWREGGEDDDVDPDDELLAETPPDVITMLGFDPRELEGDTEAAADADQLAADAGSGGRPCRSITES